MSRQIQRIDNLVLIAALILCFILSRALIRVWLGFLPNPTILENHWQHSDLAWLSDNFLETLLYLHSQPPLWNAFIGLVTQIVGADPESVSWVISLCFSAMSLVMMFAFVWFARRSGCSKLAAAGIGLVIAVSPTVVYYENYPFYPHFTAFFTTGLFVAAAQLERDTFGPIIALFVIAAILSLTWAVFHPVFILLLGGLCLAMYPVSRSPAGIVAILLALLVAQAPSLKNERLFGQDFASSWLGINLMQTLPDRSDDLETYCKFETVVDGLVTGEGLANVEIVPVGVVSVDAMVKLSSGHANMNNLLVSERAADCFDIYLQELPKEPLGYVRHFGERLFASHSKPPFIYAFRPEGWDVNALVDRIYYKLGPVSAGATALSYLAVIGYALWRIRDGRDRRLYIFALFVISYFTFITHFANGGEQQRMRVTIEPLYWFLLIGLFSDIGKYFAQRLPKKIEYNNGT